MSAKGNLALPLIVGPVFAVVGYGIAASTFDLRLDPGTCIYTARHGYWPFVKTVEGTFADFDSMAVVHEPRQKGVRENWSVVLRWKEKRLPRFVLENAWTEAEARRLAVQFSERLRLSLDLESAQTQRSA